MDNQPTTESTEPTRPWWRKKRFIIPAALFAVGGIASAWDSEPAPLSAEDAAAVERVAETDETELAETTTTEAEPTTTTAAPTTTTTVRPTTTTTPKVENWNYDQNYTWNIANLEGMPVDTDLQWQVDEMARLLARTGVELDERHWAIYVFYADHGCNLFEGFIDIGIEENWSRGKARRGFDQFVEFQAETIREYGMTEIDQSEANMILTAATVFGGCEDRVIAFLDFVQG